MHGKRTIALGCRTGNWMYKLIAGTTFILVSIAANLAVAADLSQLECRKVKVNSDPYDTATAYVCKPKTKIATTNKVKQKPSFKKTKLANNTSTKSMQDMELGKIYPAPEANKIEPPKSTIKKQAKKITNKSTPTKVTSTQKPRPMITFNYDLGHRDYQINSLQEKDTEQKTEPTIAEPKPAPKVRKFIDSSNSKLGHPYIGMMFGASIAKIGESQWDTTNNDTQVYYQYNSTSGYNTDSVYGINGGYEFELKNNLLLSIGIGIYQTPNLSSSGKVYYSNDYSSTNKELLFDYKYKLRSTRFMAETQLSWKLNRIIPFITIGVGPSLNFANNYEETVVNDSVQSRSGFKSNTVTKFAYQLGLGAAYPFNTDTDRLSIGYKYTDLGKSHFDEGERDLAYCLDTGKIRTHEIYVGYTHLFNF